MRCTIIVTPITLCLNIFLVYFLLSATKSEQQNKISTKTQAQQARWHCLATQIDGFLVHIDEVRLITIQALAMAATTLYFLLKTTKMPTNPKQRPIESASIYLHPRIPLGRKYNQGTSHWICMPLKLLGKPHKLKIYLYLT